jgi:hypothetical protein
MKLDDTISKEKLSVKLLETFITPFMPQESSEIHRDGIILHYCPSRPFFGQLPASLCHKT